MRERIILLLTTAVLILSGCASSKMPLQPPIPPLDSSLAADCRLLPEPPEGGYDDLMTWMVSVIGMYGDCAARHKQTVNAWSNL